MLNSAGICSRIAEAKVPRSIILFIKQCLIAANIAVLSDRPVLLALWVAIAQYQAMHQFLYKDCSNPTVAGSYTVWRGCIDDVGKSSELS